MLPETLLKTCKAKDTQSIRQHTDKVKEAAQILIDLGCVQDKRIENLLMLACEYHDYGKVNHEFQNRIENKFVFQENREVAHNILSYFFVDKAGLNKEDYQVVAAAVLYHHYHGDITSVVKNKGQLIDKLLEPFKEYVKKKNKETRCYRVLAERHPDAILVKGLLHRCDYSASAGIRCEYPHDFLKQDMEALLNTWKSTNANAKWNDLQIFCAERKQDNLLVTAPTGMGKTEAALLWIGNHKGFFVLPLRTAINAMYDRISQDIIRGNKGECVALLHSDAMSYYLKQQAKSDGSEDPIDYYTRSRQMSLPLTICTLDQLFNFVYKYPGYEYKLATLSYSKIVIDEIQVYDPELLAYLIFGIAWIRKMGGKVAVLTATMPPFAKKMLEEALEEDFASADFSHQGIKRHNIKVLDEQLNSHDIYAFFEKIKAAEIPGNNILVVCNSIKTAQRMQDELDEQIGKNDAEIKLLHAHFTAMDRAEKEKEILEDWKTEKPADKIKIWIATSIVEASLDIDFDYLFTELMDLFSLFQRLGRCNRKGLKPTDRYNCFVYLEKQGAVMKYVDETIYQCSRNALLEVDGIVTEQEKTAMIERALSAENLENSEYTKKYHEVYGYIDELFVNEKEENEARLRNIQSVTIIPGPIYQEYQQYLDKKSETLNAEKVSLKVRIENRDAIYQHTVSIPKYQFENSIVLDHLSLGRWDKLPILDCEYTKKTGLVFKNKEKTPAPRSQSSII
ncbi:CRISPR-associated helicase Cas3' [Anaerovorax odorimutans]|uniref:CRISPR-associated helicase Cas3 n=1 Tax=Anaerovorax odorimutans TaxID=109327 RepID=A0ABT1RLP8_9FIRM|nr:CRISPR-associated helicase Cas3' [Anaerovorax odorimutans]MCQ4636090.1 CRISPR-associated helicase Cas3' [Anaerovorax odorimutans]